MLMAGTEETIGRGVRLLASYSLGLGVPFFATALMINRFFSALGRIRPHYHTIEVVSGVLLVAIGVLIFTDKFTVIAQWLTPYLPVY
jgi:cytochrome c-type biogenesis protein